MDLLKYAIENGGLGVASFVFMVIYILTDKKEAQEDKKTSQNFINEMVLSLNNNTNTLKEVNDNQKEITNTLEKLNYKIENIENKINKKEV